MVLEIANEFGDCEQSTAGSSFGQVDVTFKVLGVTRHTVAYLPYVITVDGIGNCEIHE